MKYRPLFLCLAASLTISGSVIAAPRQTTYPDLRVSVIEQLSDQLEEGKLARFNVTICNFSRRTTPEVTLEVTVDGSHWQSYDVPALGYMGWTSQYITGYLPAGEHTVSVLADSQNLIAERNESNNSSSLTFMVNQPPSATQVIGVVIDNDTGYGVAGVRVEIDGVEAFTDSSGTFRIFDVSLDAERMIVNGYKAGYYSFWACLNGEAYPGAYVPIGNLQAGTSHVGEIRIINRENPPPPPVW